MLYNIIGDIHCRKKWEKLVREDCINIFVGDYFSPYDDIPFDEQAKVFYNILRYKEEHPDTILLRGNHDLGGYVNRPYNRDGVNTQKVNEILKENEGLLRTAYSIENKALVTHAGLSFAWYDRYKNHHLMRMLIDCSYDDPEEIENPYTHKLCKVENPVKFSDCTTPEEAFKRYYDKYYSHFAEENKKPINGQFLKWYNTLWQYDKEEGKFVPFKITPDEAVDFIEGLWKNGKYSAFSFDANSGPMDFYGDTETHSPLWIRIGTLAYCNPFEYTDYWQIVGHTWVNHVTIDNDRHLAYVDCQQFDTQSLIYDSEKNIFTINKV